jgi:hypothetical protein
MVLYIYICFADPTESEYIHLCLKKIGSLVS